MGVIYKLKPEIKDFILEKKKANPLLSCRSLSHLVQENFKITVSKSSINFLFKAAGLSLSAGRRKKKISPLPKTALTPPEELKEQQPEVKLILGPAETPPPQIPIEQTEKESEVLPQEELKEEPQEERKQEPEREVYPEPPKEIPPVPPKEPEEMKTEEAREAPMAPEAEEPQQELPVAPPQQPAELVETPKAPAVEEPIACQCTGAIFLKAADYLIGGSHSFSQVIKQYIEQPLVDLLARTEGLIYLPLLDTDKSEAGRVGWPFLTQVFSKEALLAYLTDLKEIGEITRDIQEGISDILKEVRCLKVNFLEGSALYLDGQLHTVWSTAHIPYSFATPLGNIKHYINTYFFADKPFIIFTAPGYDVPPKEFFHFLFSFSPAEKKISRLNLFGQKLEELGAVPLEDSRIKHFLFGLWPWQFGHYRKVNKISEFKRFHHEMSKQDFYLAEIELELTQPDLHQTISLTGCALKRNLQDKIRLVILSNLWSGSRVEELAALYLDRWPNLEEAFQDYSRKIELFTYAAAAAGDIFSTEDLNLERDPPPDIDILLGNYLKALDLYVRWRLLPFGYEEKDFLTCHERFYSLKATGEKEKGFFRIRFQPPAGYKFLVDLEYACRRVNESEIVLAQDRRLWLSVEPG